MFTEADLAALVPPKIFERGTAYYYEDDAVGPIQRKGNIFKARVEGTDTYRVSLEIRASGLPVIACNCPYEHGEVCKHGIALGLAVLDLVSDDFAEAELAPAVKAGKAEEAARLLQAVWERTSDHEKLEFLRQLLVQKTKQRDRFLKVFGFDKKGLAARPVQSQYVAKPKPARRPLTLTEQAQHLLTQQRGPELLPLLLSVDWLQNPPAWDSHTLPYLLGEAARFQPEATLDAVMERFEGVLENKTLRAYPLYNRLASSLQALVSVPALTKQVQFFASELLQRHRRLHTLRDSLGRAGFGIIAPAEATGLLPKPRNRPLRTAAIAPVPKRRGRQPKKPG